MERLGVDDRARGRSHDRVPLVDARHRVLWRFPTARDLARGQHLNFDDDAFVEPGGQSVISNEEEAHTIVSVNIRTHERSHLYGTPGVRGSGTNELNTPDDAYLLPNGTLTVADAYNCRVLFVRAHRIVRQLGTTGVCRHGPPAYLGAVNGDTPLADGGVLVSEIQGSWIDDISASGRLRWAVQAPVSYPSDPQPLSGGRILLADYARPGAVLIMNSHGRVLWRYAPTSGPGELDYRQRRLPRSRRDRRPAHEHDRVGVRLGELAGNGREPPQDARRDGLRASRAARDPAVGPRPPPLTATRRASRRASRRRDARSGGRARVRDASPARSPRASATPRRGRNG
jgi:hypothetical protein